MDMSEFARKALEWEELQRKADELAVKLEAATVELGKTQTIGNVRVSYSAKRGRYDYEAAWRDEYDHLPSSDYQKVTYDYRAACKDAEIDTAPFYSQTSGPSAKIKLLS